MAENPEKTRTEETERKYLQIAHDLQRRFLLARIAESGSDTLLNPAVDPDAPLPDEQTIAAEDAATLHTFTELVTWFVECCASWSPATIRLRRSALKHWMTHEFNALPTDISLADRGTVEHDIEHATTLLDSITPPRKRDLPKRTSALKRKSIPLSILKRLSAQLQSRKDSVWSVRALRFLLAGIVSGLRPIEWETVQAIENADGTLSLLVQNAKATNGRGNGPTRSICIPAGIDRTIIEEHLFELDTYRSSTQANHKIYIDRARFALYKANQALSLRPGEPRVTLYTGRHQFAANKKAEGLTKHELAELMGHESEETAGAHYGRRRSGWGRKPGADQSVALNAARPGSR